MYNYSFIIPHKNCPDLLKRCVESIPERDDVQIIVVDDNSDEGKKPGLQGRKGLEIVQLDTSRSKGAGRARNVGLERARGKWILFPDSDDYYADNFLEVLDKYINSNVEVVYFNFDYKDGKTGELLTNLEFRQYFDNYDGSKDAKENVKFRHNVPWTKMLRKAFADKHKLRFEEVPSGNDMFFSMICGYYAVSIAVEKKTLYVYLKNGNSITSKVLMPKEALCYIEHMIKQNSFFKALNHPEWVNPVWKCILYFIKKSNWKFLFYLIGNIPSLLRHKNDWASIVTR